MRRFAVMESDGVTLRFGFVSPCIQGLVQG